MSGREYQLCVKHNIQLSEMTKQTGMIRAIACFFRFYEKNQVVVRFEDWYAH